MRVALYARISSASDEQELALEQQLARLRQAAGDAISLEFVDVASGSRDDRPQLDALMQACRNGNLDQVIVTRLDRMSRSMWHGAQLLEYFCAEDTPNLIALDDGLDLATVGGRFVARMLINLGQAETERLSERVRHGKAYHRQQLRPFGPKAPFGYRWTADRSNFELDPDAAPTARLVLDRFLATGEVIKTLRYAMTLPHNRLTTSVGLRAWLHNPALIGARCYGSVESIRDSSGKQRKRNRPPGCYEQVIADTHPALISPLEHAQIRAILEDHRQRNLCHLQAGFTRELTGLVVCGHCQHRMNYYFQSRGVANRMRCVNLTCSLNYKNVVKVPAVTEAIWHKLRSSVDLLAMTSMGHQWREQEQTGEINHLLTSIQQLCAMGDPMLAEVIAAKEKQLEDLIQQNVQHQQLQWPDHRLRDALSDDRYWTLMRSDRDLTRRMFTDYVQQVVVTNRQVEAVLLRA